MTPGSWSSSATTTRCTRWPRRPRLRHRGHDRPGAGAEHASPGPRPDHRTGGRVDARLRDLDAVPLPARRSPQIEIPVRLRRGGPGLRRHTLRARTSARSFARTREHRGGSRSAASPPGSPTSSAVTRGWTSPVEASPGSPYPRGAVGIAGEFSSVYPRRSPGGWQLLGHTDEPMWNHGGRPAGAARPGLRRAFPGDGRMTTLTVVDPGRARWSRTRADTGTRTSAWVGPGPWTGPPWTSPTGWSGTRRMPRSSRSPSVAWSCAPTRLSWMAVTGAPLPGACGHQGAVDARAGRRSRPERTCASGCLTGG